MLILCHYLEKPSRFEEKRLGSDIVVTRKKRRCKVAGGFKLTICPKSITDYWRRDLGKGIDRYLGASNNFAIDTAGNLETTRKFSAGSFGTKKRDPIRVLMQNVRNVLSRTR